MAIEVRVGQSLSATAGTWTNDPIRFAYQWRRGGAVIKGATASIYVADAVDIGNILSVSVVAINSSGTSAPATSAATGAVTAASGGVLNFSQATNSGLIGAIAA